MGDLESEPCRYYFNLLGNNYGYILGQLGFWVGGTYQYLESCQKDKLEASTTTLQNF
jgi:hypothetical protein